MNPQPYSAATASTNFQRGPCAVIANHVDFFMERSIVSMVISIIMVIVGAVAVLGLPTAQFPNIADPQIQVNATFMSTNALTVEQSVATPIEQQMSGVDNMEYMYSLNANNGTMKLTVDFNIKTDASTDQILAQMRQNQAASQLPAAVNHFSRHHFRNPRLRL